MRAYGQRTGVRTRQNAQTRCESPPSAEGACSTTDLGRCAWALTTCGRTGGEGAGGERTGKQAHRACYMSTSNESSNCSVLTGVSRSSVSSTSIDRWEVPSNTIGEWSRSLTAAVIFRIKSS
jgi:hypothetical protein